MCTSTSHRGPADANVRVVPDADTKVENRPDIFVSESFPNFSSILQFKSPSQFLAIFKNDVSK